MEKPHPAIFFGDYEGDISEFISEWNRRNRKLQLPDIVEQAAEGIMEEGRLVNQDFEAELIIDQLQRVKDKSKKEIFECAVRLYTADSFLYKLVDSSMRSHDMSKVDTLGAYCYLLQMHLFCSRDDNQVNLTVYRCANLTDELIEEYKQLVGTHITWFTFTSTTKNRRMIEQRGNTLFIIQIKGRSCPTNTRSDITSLSYYPHEQEVLLQPGYRMKIAKVKQYDDPISNEKYFKIYIKY
ncbi:unnamed protein product [Didymodactylos carnosus]|uniref:NAD(P)(+)--arginine ADP-ribosyltransferase n=1 Tax=Didymodactylos carnosus TaxID=1234261 RepID=A0A813R472_9BILA|nr:unnamed protein product [Didymodactylos carnosus]CAF3558189.1 unnamed protein product [Didymodactylos carnosus]